MLTAIYLSQGKAEDALALARGLRARRPDLALGDELLGDVEARRGRAREAAAAYQAGLRKAPSSSPLAVRLHGALAAAGNMAQANDLARSWLKQHPGDPAFLTHLGTVAVATRDYDVAEARFSEALRVEPDNPVVLNNLAWVLATKGKPGATAMAERANRLAPNEPGFMDTLAHALAADGKLERAIEVQTRALNLNAQAHGRRLNLARIYLQAGDRASARRELETLARLGDRFPRQSEVQALSAKL
jgi:predicted Zn-dependent protease